MRSTVLLLIMWAACIGKRGMLLAATDESGATLTAGCVSLVVFGIALSTPPVAAVFFEPARLAVHTGPM